MVEDEEIEIKMVEDEEMKEILIVLDFSPVPVVVVYMRKSRILLRSPIWISMSMMKLKAVISIIKICYSDSEVKNTCESNANGT